MDKYKDSKDKKEPIRGVVLAYSYTDYYEEQVFIINTNPIVLVKNDSNQLVDPIEFIGEEVEYLPVNIDENKNIVIGSLREAEIITGKNSLDGGSIIIKSAVVTIMYEWGCFLLVNGRYSGKLMNKDYFVNFEEESSRGFKGGKLMNIFSVGDEIPNLKGINNEKKAIIDLYLPEKIDLSKIESYPLNSIDEIQDGQIIKASVREVFPNCCYVKIAPKADALCAIPENLDLDRDLMPEDIVEVIINKKPGKGLRGKITDVLEFSNFRYEEMDGEIAW